MKSLIGSTGLRCSLLSIMLAGSLLVAQEKKEVPKGAAPVAKPASPRLPDGFTKLSLADDQKKKIYAVRATYATKLADLEAQLKALKEKEMAEIETVLTPEQAKLLTSIRTETKKKQDDARAAKAAAEKKPAAPTTGAEPVKKPETEKKAATTEKKS